MPTHGSWRPVVPLSTGLPCTSMVAPGMVMLEVGLIAMLTTMSWPDEIPPSTPPA